MGCMWVTLGRCHIFVNFYLYVWVFCQLQVCAPCACRLLTEARRGRQVSWSWNCKLALWTTGYECWEFNIGPLKEQALWMLGHLSSFWFWFWADSHIIQADLTLARLLRMSLNSWWSCLDLLSTGITAVYHALFYLVMRIQPKAYVCRSRVLPAELHLQLNASF